MSWTNATGHPAAWRDGPATGLLHPAQTAGPAGLRRDAPVSPVLQPFVERYWSVSWDRTGLPPVRSEVLPHPSVSLSVETGTCPRFGVALPAVLVHGVVLTRFTIDLVGAGRVSAVKFRPGGFRAFTRSRPPVGTVQRLTGMRGLDGGRLLAAVLHRDDDGARAAVLDAALAPLAPEPEVAYLDLTHLLARMVGDRSLVRVDQVATVAGLSVRALQRLFAEYVGAPPKAVLARYRLHDAVVSLDAGEAGDLAGLAASLGWFDQAHFARDFRAVVGTTPSAYAAQARAVQR